MTERWLRSISVESGREEFADAIYGIDNNPVSATPVNRAANARNRVLSIEELSQYWNLLPEVTRPQITLGLRMVVAMGGLRITEILHSRKEWYSDGWLTLSKTKMDENILFL